jgi:glycosyltransferase involved in cell wall biosynthesis
MIERISKFSGRLALQQRILPSYRTGFFDALAAACCGGLSVFAGQPHPGEQIAAGARLDVAHYFPAQNHHFLAVSSPFYRCWQDGLIDWLNGWQPDALIVEANPRYPSTRQAVRWMHDRGHPVLGWGLGAPPVFGLMAGWRRWTRLQFLRSLDGLIAYSRRGAEEYRSLGVLPERIFVAPNAVAPPPTQPPPDRPTSFLSQPVLLFVGRLQARKRIDNLLRACAALPLSLQPCLWVVGDGPARKDFEVLAEKIYPGTEFFGARYGEELEEFFKSADLFVLPGTGGLAIQQAMSFGLPVIVAEGDGTQDDLVRPGNGWRIPANNLQALIEALQDALIHPVHLRSMGKESYRIVAEETNLDAMVRVFLEALASVCY